MGKTPDKNENMHYVTLAMDVTMTSLLVSTYLTPHNGLSNRKD